MARNYFQDPMQTGAEAFDQGFARTQGILDRATTNRAGRQLAGGDRTAAAATFAQGGLIDQSRRLTADQQAADDQQYERGRQQEQDKRQATRDEMALAESKVKALSVIAKGLMSVPAGERQQALQQSMPIFQQIGVDFGPFQNLTEDQLTDDNLNLFTGELEKQWQVMNLGNGGLAKANSRTGEVEVLREPDKPIIIGNGAAAFDREGRVIARNPKTFAPPRPQSAGTTGLPPGYVPR